jgi:hypothetical protein
MDNFYIDYLKAIKKRWYITLPLIILSIIGLSWQTGDLIFPFIKKYAEDLILLSLILTIMITVFIPYLSLSRRLKYSFSGMLFCFTIWILLLASFSLLFYFRQARSIEAILVLGGIFSSGIIVWGWFFQKESGVIQESEARTIQILLDDRVFKDYYKHYRDVSEGLSDITEQEVKRLLEKNPKKITCEEDNKTYQYLRILEYQLNLWDFIALGITLGVYDEFLIYNDSLRIMNDWYECCPPYLELNLHEFSNLETIYKEWTQTVSE